MSDKEKNSKDYGAEKIKVLEGLEDSGSMPAIGVLRRNYKIGENKNG